MKWLVLFALLLVACPGGQVAAQDATHTFNNPPRTISFPKATYGNGSTQTLLVQNWFGDSIHCHSTFDGISAVSITLEQWDEGGQTWRQAGAFVPGTASGSVCYFYGLVGASMNVSPTFCTGTNSDDGEGVIGKQFRVLFQGLIADANYGGVCTMGYSK